jgi:hypothetical protein
MPFTQQDALLAASNPAGTTLNITGADLAAGSVETAAIAANAVTFANLNVFVANGQTGTGSSQSIAHGLGVIPSAAWISFEGSTASQAVTYGSNTSTNVVLTVTSGAKFTVVAIA